MESDNGVLLPRSDDEGDDEGREAQGVRRVVLALVGCAGEGADEWWAAVRAAAGLDVVCVTTVVEEDQATLAQRTSAARGPQPGKYVTCVNCTAALLVKCKLRVILVFSGIYFYKILCNI